MRFFIYITLLVSSSSVLAKIETKAFQQSEINRLISIYQEKGQFSESFLKKFFKDKRLKKIPAVVPKNVFNKQQKRNYDSFHDSYSTHLARKFMRRWRTHLARAERKYQVDKEAIVSIMLVETGLGGIKGRYHVSSVFATILLSSDDQIHDHIDDEKMREYQDTNFFKKLKRKRKWAEGEILALLELEKEKALSAHKLKGSSSGAFGLCQFLPSSFQKWAVDGDKSGKINLDWKVDAIYSVANYLKEHGWKKGLSNKENRDAVYAYNHSWIYVDTILEVAERLAKKKTK